MNDTHQAGIPEVEQADLTPAEVQKELAQLRTMVQELQQMVRETSVPVVTEAQVQVIARAEAGQVIQETFNAWVTYYVSQGGDPRFLNLLHNRVMLTLENLRLIRKGSWKSQDPVKY